MKRERQEGSVTLETGIFLPIFIIFFLFVYGLFAVISTRNQMTHALVQAAKSLSMDAYLTEHVESAPELGTKFWGGLSDMVIDLVRLGNEPEFSSELDWYSTDMWRKSVVGDRFRGFLAGDRDAAEERLKELKIVNQDVDFKVDIAGEELTITMTYQIQYWFDFFDLGKIDVKQKVQTHLWK